jgi:sugar lactone lactonase YvrE
MLQNTPFCTAAESSYMRSSRPFVLHVLNRCAVALCALALTVGVSAQNIANVVGTGAAGSNGDGAAAKSANILGANGLAFDRSGNLYIADSLNHKVRKVGLDGVITTFAGTGVAGFSGDGSAANKAALNYPVMLAFARDGALLIADYANHRIRRVAPDGVIATIAGNGSEGFAGDGGAATAAQLNNPIGVAVGADDSIYIGDAQNHRVRKVSATGVISTIAGTGTAGFSGDGAAAAAAQFNFPGALVVDAADNLYVADYANNRVRKVAPNGIVSTFAGTGTGGLAGDNGAATAAQLLGPFALSLGTNGSLLIADQVNNRIRRVASNGTITTVAGGGTSFLEGAKATDFILISPSGVASDAAGQVWISDRGTYRIRKITSPLKSLTEFRLAASDYYFYTSRDIEKQALDGLAGWSRTGNALLVNVANDAGTKPIMRYYFDAVAQNNTRGNHFYTLFENEIAGLNALNPNNVRSPGLPFNEGIEAYATPPTIAGTSGSCPANTTPVYRAFRGASIAPDNPAHRYSADLAAYNTLVASGWSGEGVAYCSAIAP